MPNKDGSYNAKDYGLDPKQFIPVDSNPITPGNPTGFAGHPVPPPTVSTQAQYLRTTLPLAVQYQPDLTSQAYTGSIPTIRLMPVGPSGSASGNSASSSVAQAVVTASSSGSSNSNTVTSPPSQLVVITTPSIAVNAISTGSVQMAQSFVLLNVQVSLPARVRLYSTSSAQAADLNRPNSVPPTPGLANYVISDHYLTGAAQVPLSFPCSPPPVGANQDNVQSATVYWSITNIGLSTTAISAIFTFVPLES